MRILIFAFSFVLFVGIIGNVTAQKWLVPSDSLNRVRAQVALIGVSTIYATFSYGLYNTWYKQYNLGTFHSFDDRKEWRSMDKMGHIYTAYIQSDFSYSIARWTGLRERKSILTGAISGTLFQSTLEIMDGFSEKWGFSWSDIVANTVGTGLFSAQQLLWQEQRIVLKMNSIPKRYNSDILLPLDPQDISRTTLKERATELYGQGYLERFLKDYNAQTYWLSINLRSFESEWKMWPKWLNLAIGYGADNLYGGFKNQWQEGTSIYSLHPNQFPRTSQFYLGFDIDPRYLGIKNRLWSTLSKSFTLFKIPSPAIEVNSKGHITFHIFR
jgi:hypothetical protein